MQPIVEDGLLNHASMRPRHYTAENVRRYVGEALNDIASMRPRHYTAENPKRTRGPPESPMLQ